MVAALKQGALADKHNSQGVTRLPRAYGAGFVEVLMTTVVEQADEQASAPCGTKCTGQNFSPK